MIPAAEWKRRELSQNDAAMAALGRRLLLATLCVAALGASLVAVLRAPVASAPLRVPLFPRGQGEARLLPLAERTTLRTGAVEELLRPPRLDLVLGPLEKRARLLGAQLRLAGSACTFDLAAATTLQEETAIALERAPACADEEREGRAEATLVVRSEGGLALGVLEPRAGAPDERHFLRVRVGAEDLPVRLFAVRPSSRSSVRRIDLLAFQWRDEKLSGIDRVLALSALLAILGALLFPWGEASGLRLVAGTGVGAGLFAAALAVAYAILVPPLAALDEPYHLRSYALLTGQPELEAEVLRWAEVAHVTRVRFRPDKTFRPEDRENPFRQPDPFSFAPDVRSRSAATTVLWRSLAPLVGKPSAPRTLLALRLANSALFALAVGLAAALLAATAPARWPQLLAVSFLLVPSLPFFATALAELALLTTAAVLVAAGLVTLVLDGERSSWAGVTLGVGGAVLFAGGRSPWPLGALLAAVLLARVLLGPRSSGHPAREAAIFWGGLAVGTALFFVLADPVYVGGVSSDRIVAIAPKGFGTLVVALVRSPWPALVLLGAAAVVEIVLGPWRRRLAPGLAPVWRSTWRAAAAAGVVFVLLSLAGSLVVHYPSLPFVPIPNPYPAAEYMRRALTTFATVFRLRDPDFLTFSSFWAGFGWNDTIPPAPFLIGLAAALAAAVVSLLLYFRRRDEPRPPAFLAAFVTGVFASLVLYAIAIHRLPMNMTGRYLAGWHLAVAALAGSAAALARAPGSRAALVPRTVAFLLAAGAVHVYCLAFILRRYF
jgi:hypothetical protein